MAGFFRFFTGLDGRGDPQSKRPVWTPQSELSVMRIENQYQFQKKRSLASATGGRLAHDKTRNPFEKPAGWLGSVEDLSARDKALRNIPRGRTFCLGEISRFPPQSPG